MDAPSSPCVNRSTETCPRNSNTPKYGNYLYYFRGKSCKFVPQKVGLAHILMDEDVIQIYKNKTKAQIKKEKIGADQPNEPKKV